MPKTILKVILTIFIFMAVSRQLPALHHVTKQLFAKKAQKGFSSLEKFNNHLWRR